MMIAAGMSLAAALVTYQAISKALATPPAWAVQGNGLDEDLARLEAALGASAELWLQAVKVVSHHERRALDLLDDTQRKGTRARVRQDLRKLHKRWQVLAEQLRTKGADRALLEGLHARMAVEMSPDDRIQASKRRMQSMLATRPD